MSVHSAGAADGNQSITASLIGQVLRRAKVVAVNVVGGPGCGKTTLILQTLARLAGGRVGVIATSSVTNPDAQHFAVLTEHVAEVGVGTDMKLSADKVLGAIQRLNLTLLELLMIENNSDLLSANKHDLGESKRVAVFSVAAGAHKAKQYAELVKSVDAVVINKLDLLTPASFDLKGFRADISRLNPDAELFEISATDGTGLEKWVSWLKSLIMKGSIPSAAP